jgi:serine/threonine-protein phosphatase 4 regulatory subunit 1
MSDEVDHIRQSVCLSLPALCRRIESPDYRRSFAIKAVIVLTESGEDVRCAALEMLGEVIYIFEKDPRGPPFELLRVYMEDRDDVARDEETDWDVVASFNVSRP